MPAQRRSRSEWSTLFEAFDAGGITEAEFCAQHGISPKYFQKKRALLRRADRSGSAFVQARIGAPQSVTVQIGEVQLRSTGLPPAAWLAELASALRQ